MADYCTLPEVRAWVGITSVTDTGDDAKITVAITAASRWIDTYCQVQDGGFATAGSATARTFTPRYLTELDLDGWGIGDITGLTVKTDASGDGTFETTWAASDYELLPANALANGRPYTKLRAVGTRTFPWLINTWLTRLDRVQITAKWGWPATPEPVHQAAIIQAARLFARRQSIDGLAGGADFALRVSSRVDPDVESLLHDFRRAPVLVA